MKFWKINQLTKCDIEKDKNLFWWRFRRSLWCVAVLFLEFFGFFCSFTGFNFHRFTVFGSVFTRLFGFLFCAFRWFFVRLIFGFLFFVSWVVFRNTPESINLVNVTKIQRSWNANKPDLNSRTFWLISSMTPILLRSPCLGMFSFGIPSMNLSEPSDEGSQRCAIKTLL